MRRKAFQNRSIARAHIVCRFALALNAFRTIGIFTERSSPEEYRTAVLMVLRAGDGVERRALTDAVRSLFGFSRTGTNLDSLISAAIEKLLAVEIIGRAVRGCR